VTGRRLLTDQWRATLAAAIAVALTSVCLAPTLSGGGWWGSVLVVLTVVALVGGLLRSASAPAWVVVPLQGLALLLVMTALFAGDQARFGVLPGLDVWQVVSANVEEGLTTLNQEIAPVQVTEGISMIVVGGVALIAWSVDAIAVTWRRATLAGIPLLALYLVPATVLPDGVPWPLFLLAGVGWLLLLLTDGRRELAKWGRPLDPIGGAHHSVGGTGRRLGAAALTVAVIVPIVLPSLEDGRFGTGAPASEGEGGTGSQPAEQRVLTVNPLTDLQRNLARGADEEVLNYATETTTPQYLRIATLDQFNGTTWTLEEMEAGSDQQAARGLPLPPGLSPEIARTEVEYLVAVGPLDTPRLPLPYPVSVVDIEGDWRWDAQTLDVFSAEEDGTAIGQSYTATHLALDPTVEQLRAAPEPSPELTSMLALPDDVDDYLTPIAASVVADETTDYDRALALQNWFLSRFEYSLDQVSGNSSDALRSFLDDRSGYCEQFAATMALMARTLGIPSRVQVGFTPGEVVEAGVWQVTLHDAHAWPELWFEGVGWVRFEPTPGGGDGSAAPAWAPAPQNQSPTAEPRREGNGGVVLRRGGGRVNGQPAGKQDLRDVLEANRAQSAVGASSGQDGGTGSGESSQTWLWLTIALLTAAALLAPTVAARLTRRTRWRGVADPVTAVSAAWDEVLDAATDVDLAPSPTETARDLAARLPKRGGLSRERGGHLVELASWVEQVRYRGRADGLPSPGELRFRAEAIRAELLGSLSARDRRLATWWPASGRAAVVQAWNGGTEWLATATQRVGDRLLRRRRRDGAPSALPSGS
jgi:transglutaminase-like putative cysteine protease